MTDGATIVTAGTRLVRLPVDPPRGDAIQKFDALEVPIVDIADRGGVGFGYTIGRRFSDPRPASTRTRSQPHWQRQPEDRPDHGAAADLARVGGITNALTVCHMAAAANLPVAPHVSPELSITVAAAVPNSVFVEYIPQMEPLLKRPLIRHNGYGIPSDAPGHGVEFDPDAVERFTVPLGASLRHTPHGSDAAAPHALSEGNR